MTSPGGFEADPTVMHADGQRLAMMRDDSNALFTASHVRLEDAGAAGWVGDSARALTERLETMHDDARAVVDRLHGQSETMHSSATAYETTDTSTADDLRAVGPRLNI